MTDYGSSDYGGGDPFAGGSYTNNFASDGSNGLFDMSGTGSAATDFGQAGMDQFDQAQFSGAGQGYGADPTGVGPQNYISPQATATNQQIAQDPTQQLQGSTPQQQNQPGQGGVGQQRSQGGQPQQQGWLNQLMASLSGGQQNLGFGEGPQGQGPQQGWSQWNTSGQQTPDFINSPATGYPAPGGGQPDAAGNIANFMRTMGGATPTPGAGVAPSAPGSGAIPASAAGAPGQTTMPVSSLIAGGGGGDLPDQTQNVTPDSGAGPAQTGATPAPNLAGGATPAPDSTGGATPTPVQTQPYTPSQTGATSAPQGQPGGATQAPGQYQPQGGTSLTNTLQRYLQQMGLGPLSALLAPLLARQMQQRMGGGFGGRGGMMMGRGRHGRGGFHGGMPFPSGIRLPPGMRGQVMNPGGIANLAAGGGGQGGQGIPGLGAPDQTTSDGTTPTSAPQTGGTPNYVGGAQPPAGSPQAMGPTGQGFTQPGTGTPATAQTPAVTPTGANQPAPASGTIGGDTSALSPTPMGPTSGPNVAGGQGDRTFRQNMTLGPQAPPAQPVSPQSFQRSRPAGTNTPPTPGFSTYLKQQRSRYAQEINGNPNMRPALAAIMATENAQDPIGPMEALVNRASMTGQPLSQMLSPSFYGPMRTGGWQRAFNQYRNNPNSIPRQFNTAIDQVLNGSNVLGGATDQGSGRDPNTGWSGGRVTRGNETYNDWGGFRGHGHAAQWRQEQQRQVAAEQPRPMPAQIAAIQQNPGWAF